MEESLSDVEIVEKFLRKEPTTPAPEKGATTAGDDNDNSPPVEHQPTAGEPDTPLGDTSDDDAGQSSQGPEITTSDLSRMLGVDDDFFDLTEDGKVVVKAKIDGTDVPVSLKDLIADHQKRGHADRAMQEAAEMRKSVEAERQKIREIGTQKLQTLDAMVRMNAEELMGTYQSIDWNRLRAENPAEYAALQHDFQQRQQKIAQAIQAIEHEKTTLSDGQQREQAERMRAAAEEDEKRIPQLIPEWKDQAKRREGTERMLKFALEHAQKWGADSDSVVRPLISSMQHSGFLVDLVRLAQKGAEMEAGRPGVEKKVLSSPKIVRPGTPRQTDGKAEKIKNLKKTIAKSGGKSGIHEYLIATGKV